MAAETTDEERVRLIDLTNFMCDQANCFPVVGGALVIRDIGHLTRTFSDLARPLPGARDGACGYSSKSRLSALTRRSPSSAAPRSLRWIPSDSRTIVSRPSSVIASR